MKDPRRLRQDESVATDLRDLIAKVPLPGALPPDVRARYRGAIGRKVRRQRRRMLGFAMGAAAVSMGAFIAYRLPEVSSETADNQTSRIRERKLSVEPAPVNVRARESSPSCADCVLVPSRAGWLERSSNRFGAQGAFYVDASSGSTVLQPTRPARHRGRGWLWRNEGEGRLCLKGSSAAVLNGDYQTNWGVVAGVELCHTAPDADARERTFAITECPWGSLETLKGIRFNLDGPDIPSEMRVVFSEIQSNENAFVALYDATRGRHEIRMDDARVSYQQPPRPVRRNHVRGVEWLIPGRLGKPANFDFCIADIELF